METTATSAKTGGSGARIEILSDFGLVRKSVEMRNYSEFTHLHDQYLWMKAHSHYLPDIVPKIYDCGFTSDKRFFYDMDYVRASEQSITFEDLQNIIDSVLGVKFPSKSVRFEAYIDRLYSHLSFLKNRRAFNQIMKVQEFIVNVNGCPFRIPNIKLFDFFQVLEQRKDHYSSIASNCHGDLTLCNIIGKNIIDSNHLMGGWNSWILDVSKLFQSLHHGYEEVFSDKCEFKYEDCSGDTCIPSSQLYVSFKFPRDEIKSKMFEHMTEKFDREFTDLLIFELSHYLRMLKYKLAISEGDFVKAYTIMCMLWEEIESTRGTLRGIT